jgi:hypothetical protein
MEEKNLYQRLYPSYLDWNCRIWTIKAGHRLKKDGVVYRVKEVVRSPTPGERPSLMLEAEKEVSDF